MITTERRSLLTTLTKSVTKILFVTFFMSSAMALACTGAVQDVSIPFPEAAGRVGNTTTRHFCVVLPADYDNSDRAYPVIFVLPGLTGNQDAYFSEMHLERIATRVFSQIKNDAIVVGVDTSTKLGSTYFEDSPTMGSFESFALQAMVPYFDSHYRTLATGRGRALMGHSTGGFNAVSLAIRHPDVFSNIAALSPDGLDLKAWLLDESGKAMRQRYVEWVRSDEASTYPGQMKSFAGNWSYDSNSPSGYVWPIDLVSGVLLPEVWLRWESHSPSVLVKKPANLSKVTNELSGHIFISVGKDDEFDLARPARIFSLSLESLGIRHVFEETDDTHASHLSERFERALKFLMETMH